MARIRNRNLKMITPWTELVSLGLVVVLMILSWFLTHGLTKGMYDQFATLGDPPSAIGPVGEAGRNQLGHWGYFWSERAFHYRTTLMFAVDDFTSPDVLANDTAQQYPTGVDAWREYTLLMEPVYGQLYRWFGGQKEILVEFLLRLIPLVHVLLFLPLYLLARALGARPLLSALAVVLYATCTMGFARFTGSLLLKENFALLWMMIFLAAHFQADRRRSVPWLVTAALSLVILLASWHLSQFLVLVILGAVALSQLSGRHPYPRWSILVPVVYFAAGLLAGLTPSLLARGFFFSPTMAVMVSWLATALLQARFPSIEESTRRRLGILVGLLLALGTASFLNRHFAGDYNHIFGLLVQKVAHGFSRPSDPQLLPFDVRVFWASPFTSPSWAEIWSKLGFHVLLLGPSLAAGIFFLIRGGLDRRQRAFFIMTPVFCLAWLLIERLGVVFLPFAVATCAVVVDILVGRWEASSGNLPGHSTKATLAVVALMILTPVANLAGTMSDRLQMAMDVTAGRPAQVMASDQVHSSFRGDLFRWLVSNTPGPLSRFGPGQAQAVLGEIGVSPQVLLYTRRPVILNSQFENQPIRRRYEFFLQALFSEDPNRLEAFLKEYQAGYLFINRNWAASDAPGSAAYLAGLSGPLNLDLNIARLHFAPESLDFLQPVYNNEFYRLFKIGPRQGEVTGTTWDRNFSNWWGLKHYQVVDGQLADLDGDRRRLLDFEKSLVALQEEEGRLMKVLATQTPPGQPSLPELHQRYMEFKLENLARSGGVPQPDQERQMEQLINAIQGRLSSRDPKTGRPVGQAMAALFTLGLPGQSPGWRTLLETGLAEPSHLAAAGQLLAMLGQYRQAADLLAKAEGTFPLVDTVAGDGRPGPEASNLALRIRQTAVWYLLAADKVAEAKIRAARFAPFAPSGSRLVQFFQQVAAIPAD